MESEPLLDSLRSAVTAMPDDVPLRLHLAALLLRAGQRDEAVRHLGAVLQRDPGNGEALALLTGQHPSAPAAPSVSPERTVAPAADSAPAAEVPDTAGDGDGPATPSSAPATPSGKAKDDPTGSYDWSQAEDELRDVLPAMFVGDAGSTSALDEARAYDAEPAGLTLADVAGLTEVKQRLEAAFLAPLRNPELVKLYGKSLRGGLLLYGPPGCGKTFIARAVAGEMGAQFLPVGLADVLDMYIGQSERNLHDVFETARRNAPCVVFLDEVDALGQKRSQLRHTATRGTVNQLLTEMDGLSADNDGVFVLGATNHPWDVDVALRRPGRFDRMLLVLPPDEAARQALIRYHLRTRPIEAIDVVRLSKRTEGYSGA